MAAINVHIGTQAPEDRQDDTCDVGALGARASVPPIEQMHVGQTRMVWVRRALTEWMADKQYRIVMKGPELAFEISTPFENTQFPWMYDKAKTQSRFGLIGEAGKMGCPTWDLPAGSPVLGGACPAATQGQSTVPIKLRKKNEKAVGAPVRLKETICQLCYAEGGNYSTFTIQLGELIRYWWTRELLSDGREDEWIETVVEAIRRSRFPLERADLIDPRTGRPVLPMRVHSSGDFFSQKYAAAWIEVANRLPEITFWAPTRTWAGGEGWIEFWREASDKILHKNLIVRPSAYHTDDPAPGPGNRMIPCETGHDTNNPHIVMRPETPWSEGPYPFTAAGTTAVYKFNDKNAQAARDVDAIRKGGSIDPRYDWQCGTYAIMDDSKSCQNAMGPDGKEGCRVCWLYPDKRINYTAH
jgi:hypothetical protein